MSMRNDTISPVVYITGMFSNRSSCYLQRYDMNTLTLFYLILDYVQLLHQSWKPSAKLKSIIVLHGVLDGDDMDLALFGLHRIIIVHIVRIRLKTNEDIDGSATSVPLENCLYWSVLTLNFSHWGRVTHICVSELGHYSFR